MKKKANEFMLSVVSLIMCFCVLFSTSASAKNGQIVDKPSSEEYNIIDSSIMTNSIQPQAKWDIVKVRFPFILVPMHSQATYLKNVQSFQWIGTKVMVLKYTGDFTYVEVLKRVKKDIS